MYSFWCLWRRSLPSLGIIHSTDPEPWLFVSRIRPIHSSRLLSGAESGLFVLYLTETYFQRLSDLSHNKPQSVFICTWPCHVVALCNVMSRLVQWLKNTSPSRMRGMAGHLSTGAGKESWVFIFSLKRVKKINLAVHGEMSSCHRSTESVWRLLHVTWPFYSYFSVFWMVLLWCKR